MGELRFWLGVACAIAATALVLQLGGLGGVGLHLLRAGEALLELTLRAIL